MSLLWWFLIAILFVVVRISATLLNSLTLNKYSPCFSFPVQFRLPEIRMVHFLIWGFRGLLGLWGDGFELGFGSIVLLSVILLVIPSIDIMVVHFTLYLSLFIFSLSLSLSFYCVKLLLYWISAGSNAADGLNSWRLS